MCIHFLRFKFDKDELKHDSRELCGPSYASGLKRNIE